MAHMVIYREADGETAYGHVDGVADAVALVERLRNDHGVEEARIFRLEEVHFEFRPYLKVELAGAGQAGAASVIETPGSKSGATDATGEAEGEATVADTPHRDGGGARRGLFGR